MSGALAYNEYADELEELVKASIIGQKCAKVPDEVAKTLAIQSNIELRKLVPIETLREMGAFFTSHELAERLALTLEKELRDGAEVIDIACGTGDLLAACAKYLPAGKNLDETISIWATKLFGVDLDSAFVRTAQSRLLLLAIKYATNNVASCLDLTNAFSGICVGNALKSADLIKGKKCVIINPPFNQVPDQGRCKWATGKVSQAAIFLDYVLENCDLGTSIVAILPEVLRTGTRYMKWRECIEINSVINDVEIIGQFDNKTDIDVFILRLQKCTPRPLTEIKEWWTSSKNQICEYGKLVCDYFDVAVGTVVPHRDLENGASYPYITAHLLPKWSIFDEIVSRRNYSGRTFMPPFVVVRRTSRPNDKFRAVATIIAGQEPVAVENHLIVLIPKTKTLNDCLELLDVLKRDETNDWLNERIRCRHLTVNSLKNIPW
ncbi:MAG: hypothetical protein A2076_15180 [Geobacteraceae bacterium GWC2_53_11]|nr:MAG: hypothetical protein A2076_15180 [Geobacteraceae bacterium GWC2_53_11]